MCILSSSSSSSSDGLEDEDKEEIFESNIFRVLWSSSLRLAVSTLDVSHFNHSSTASRLCGFDRSFWKLEV
jgi:hypothetical protein